MDRTNVLALDREIRARGEATQHKTIDLEILLGNCASLIKKSEALLAKPDEAKI